MEDLTLSLAFLAGILSFFSPCILPLVPLYLAELSGSHTLANTAGYRWRTLLKTLCFVAGFSLLFILLGVMAGEVGSLLSKHLWLLQKIAGATLVILGLHLTGIPAIPFLNYEKRLLQPKLRNAGLLRSFLMGAAFSAGWTPCIGPVLSSILALSLSSRTATRGAFLMFVFSVGMAMPFLLIGFAFDELNPALNRIGRYVKIISIVSGVLVIIIGLLIIFDFSYLINSLVSKYLPKYY